MFITIFISIKKHKDFVNKQKGTKSTLRSKFIGALSLAVIFGLGWGFGLLAISYPVEEITVSFQVVFSIFVGTQGILIFIIHGIRSPDASRVWKQCTKSLWHKIQLRSTVKMAESAIQSTAGETSQITLPEKTDT